MLDQSRVDRFFTALDTDGMVVLPNLLSGKHLRSIQVAFEAKLRNVRWNDFDGFQKTETYRHMVEDVLLLDQDPWIWHCLPMLESQTFRCKKKTSTTIDIIHCF